MSVQLIPFKRERKETGERERKKEKKKEERKEHSIHITYSTAVKTNFSLLCIRQTNIVSISL